MHKNILKSFEYFQKIVLQVWGGSMAPTTSLFWVSHWYNRSDIYLSASTTFNSARL